VTVRVPELDALRNTGVRDKGFLFLAVNDVVAFCRYYDVHVLAG